jgi:hypothetical protein
MDPYIGSNKLATYLHPGPSGPFLELKNEPMKPPSPSTSALLQHNPSLIDLCAFNSLCQRLVENNNSTPNTSPYKPFVTPSDLFFCIPPITQNNDCSSDSNSKINPIIPETTTSPISSAGDCSPNVSSCVSTPYSSPKVKHLLQQNSPLDLCVTKDSPTTATMINKHRHSNENISTCELSGNKKKKTFVFLKNIFFLFKDFVIKTEQPTTNGQYDNKNVKQTITKHSHTSPILHRLLTSPSKLNETSVLPNQNDYIDNENNKSPQYRPRYSPFYIPETKNNTKFISKDNVNK